MLEDEGLSGRMCHLGLDQRWAQPSHPLYLKARHEACPFRSGALPVSNTLNTIIDEDD